MKRRPRKMPVRDDLQLAKRLAEVERDVKAGRPLDMAWEMFRLMYMPGLADTDAAGELGLWCERIGIHADLKMRKVNLAGKPYEVIYLTLIKR